MFVPGIILSWRDRNATLTPSFSNSCIVEEDNINPVLIEEVIYKFHVMR